MTEEMTPVSPIVTPEVKPASPLLPIVLVVVMLVSLGLAGFMWWQNQSLKQQIEEAKNTEDQKITENTENPAADGPTEGWRAHESAIGKFLVKYPSEVMVTQNDQGPTKEISFGFIGPTQKASGRTQTELFDGYKVTIQATPMTEMVDIQVAANKSRKEILDVEYGDECVVSPVINGLIDGIVTAEFSATNCMGDSQTIFTVNNGVYYQLTGIFAGQEYLTDVNQILSTFRFIADTNSQKSDDYYRVTRVNLPDNWIERGINLDPKSFREFVSSDSCRALTVLLVGSSSKTLREFVMQFIGSNDISLSPTQYHSTNFESLTTPALNAEELENTFMKVGEEIYLATLSIISQNGPPQCKLDYSNEVKNIIESLQFKLN